MDCHMKPYSNLALAATLLGALALAEPGWAADEPAGESAEEAPAWTHRAEVSYVSTGGNSESSTLGVRNTSTGAVGAGSVTLEVGALRAETTATTRFAVGSGTDFRVQEESVTAVTAENYFLRGRYERTIHDRLFWFTGAGWERNEFAGIENRIQVIAGVGHTWYESEAEGHFKTNYGVTYTDQQDVVPAPAPSESFAGLRLGWDYQRPFGANTSYGNVLLVDLNADETSDYRADMTNSLAVSMSERLALKVSLQLLYDNEPSLAALPLISPEGVATEATVVAPLDDLDTQFTVALVVDF